MNTLNETQIERLEIFFKKQSKLKSTHLKDRHICYKIKPLFVNQRLDQIRIEKETKANLYGWRTFLDSYSYNLKNRVLHSQHVPDNPYKESQEREIRSLIEQLLATVDYITRTP